MIPPSITRHSIPRRPLPVNNQHLALSASLRVLASFEAEIVDPW
jgi:hypothetical protein